MKNVGNTIILFLIVVLSILSSSAGAQISGSSSAAQITDPATGQIVDPTITVTGNTSLDGMTVQIVSNFYAGDELSWDIALSNSFGITGNYSVVSGIAGILRFSGTTTPANWQTILRTVRFSNNAASCGPATRNVRFMPGNTLYNEFNEHYYQYVSSMVSWPTARADAEKKSFNGMKGYLVTSTSPGENSFLLHLINQDIWLGMNCIYSDVNNALGQNLYANQAAATGNMYWITGPERGTFVSSGLGSPVAQNGQYMNWNGGEPNNLGDEYYVHLYAAANGRWNDFPLAVTRGYVIEYGGMPGDEPLDQTFNKTLEMTGVSGGVVTGGGEVCAGTNATLLTYSGGSPVVRWESSEDNFVTPGTVINHTGATYTASNLLRSTYFRVITNDGAGCAEATSSSTFIPAKTTVAGTIYADYKTICNGGSANLSLYGHSGTVVKWQSSTNNVNWTDISHTALVYNTGALSPGSSYFYRAEISYAPCGTSSFTDPVEITVTLGAASEGGSITGPDYICPTPDAATLTVSGYAGDIVKWEYSTDNGIVWSDIAHTLPDYIVTNISNTTLYRAVVENAGCSPVTSAVHKLTYSAQGNTWLGGTSIDFGTASNWTCGVPASGANIVISESAPFMPVLDQNRIIGNIVFENNTNLTLGSYGLTVNGNRTGPASGTFTGSAAAELIIGGTGAFGTLYLNNGVADGNQLHSLTISRTAAGNVTMGTDISVNGELNLTSGILTTGANILTLNLVTGASDQSHVNGTVRKTGNTAFTFPIGDGIYYAPISISAPAGNNDSYTASYTRANPKTAIGTSYATDINNISDQEYWSLERTAGSSAVDVTLTWQNGRSTATSGVPGYLRVAGHQAGSWGLAGEYAGETGDMSAGSVISRNVNDFGNFTIGYSLISLPVSFGNFEVRAEDGLVKLKWETMSETNNSHFIVERSTKTGEWLPIGRVNGQGNSSGRVIYSFTDPNPKEGANAYRLRQIDIDGRGTYSNIKVISIKNSANLKISPNPFDGKILVDAGNRNIGKLIIIDALGTIVYKAEFISKKREFIMLDRLAKGVYFVHNNGSVYKIVKQ